MGAFLKLPESRKGVRVFFQVPVANGGDKIDLTLTLREKQRVKSINVRGLSFNSQNNAFRLLFNFPDSTLLKTLALPTPSTNVDGVQNGIYTDLFAQGPDRTIVLDSEDANHIIIYNDTSLPGVYSGIIEIQLTDKGE